jgi:hypothetical protein
VKNIKFARALTLLPILLLSALSVSAQNVAGDWVGKIWQASSGAEFNYAMRLEQSGTDAIGRAVAQPTSGGTLGEFDVLIYME